ncbi:malto-oligosyltrehalose synthase [Sinomonas halotolerans]|uniref:Malto-oligosyltrehalose synthase n=1 Tax=Sinomonas halotolerans TaxID=1644133 RepID=A0ABU9WYQ5_9MICC
MRIPASTYRLQIRPDFTLHDAAALVPYLARLGVDWLYLSPLLQATGKSAHGYDVTDPSRLDTDRGGAEGLDAVAAAARAAGLGVLVDIVPNHVGVAVPEENPWWWSLLAEGRGSKYADAFDVDWDAGGGKVLIPVLGAPDDVARLRVEDGRLRYYEHAFPLAEGTWSEGHGAEGDSPEEVHGRQHYRLVHWREADNRLNYRRFFAVNTLAAVRVEEPWVFEEAHAEVRRWFEAGLVDGVRVDHPDGLYDPAGYLEQLRGVTGGAYTLVEKILEHGEDLPADFACEGTTGYDALALVDRVLVDPAGQEALDRLDTALRGGPVDFAEMIQGTKRWIANGILHSEILRLARLAVGASGERGDGGEAGTDADSSRIEHYAEALIEIAAQFPVYRTYFAPGRPPGHDATVLENACRAAAVVRPGRAAEIRELADRLADPAEELARRFQQTTGMIMAKAVEDTAFYRYTRLGTLTEVGGDPTQFALAPGEFHAALAERERHLPHSMTTLTTHDTKRSEDTRARITVLAELADEWAALVPRLLHPGSPLNDAGSPLNNPGSPLSNAGSPLNNAGSPLSDAGSGLYDPESPPAPAGPARVDGPLANLLWQAILGAWPASRERLYAYAEKAAREAGVHTLWTDPDEEFEQAVRALVDSAVDPGPVRDLIEEFVERTALPTASNALSAKLLQLAMPGVPDVYQGTEFWDRSLCDPDNRRDVDFAARDAALAALDAGAPVRGPLAEEAKMLVVSRTLRLRRDRPELFTGYAAVEASGPAAGHLVAFRRGERGAMVLATRLPVGLQRAGGWGATSVRLPRAMRDAFTGAHYPPGELAVGEALRTLPVALLVPADNPEEADDE